MADNWETPCPAREDRIHCTCWYDGAPCCGCGDNSAPVDPDTFNEGEETP